MGERLSSWVILEEREKNATVVDSFCRSSRTDGGG